MRKKRIKVGRLFTFVFGLVIIALSMLIRLPEVPKRW